MELDIEAQFREQLYKSYKDNKHVMLPKEEYQNIISQLLEKSPHQYYLLKKYEVIECGYVKKLIRKREVNEATFYFVSIEETFDVIKRPHIATGHGGRDKMIK